MNQTWIFLGIIFIHWFSDFVLQTDQQAKNKSTSNKALTDHVVTYSGVWFFASAIYTLVMPPYNYPMNVDYKMLLFAPITFICHFVTDYFTSRLNTKLWKAGKVHEFFVSVGFDQVLHYVQLFLTFKLLL